jgi:fructose-specific phosphotransferase system IIC component
MIEQLAAALGVKKAGLIAGFIGALISLKFLTETKTWPARVIMALCGTLCAAYVAPGVAEYFKWSDRVEGALTFAIGLFGMTFANSFMTFLREIKFGEAIATWFKRPGA